MLFFQVVSLENPCCLTMTKHACSRLKCYVFGGILQYFWILILSIASANAVASHCHSEFSEPDILNSVKSGNSISYPFKFSYLTDGEHEPELRSEILDVNSHEGVISLSEGFYSQALRKGSERLQTESENDNVQITYRGPNSGFYIQYVYKKVSGCWVLSSISNEST